MSTIEDYIYVGNHIPVEICEELIDECNKKEWKKHCDWLDTFRGKIITDHPVYKDYGKVIKKEKKKETKKKN